MEPSAPHSHLEAERYLATDPLIQQPPLALSKRGEHLSDEQWKSVVTQLRHYCWNVSRITLLNCNVNPERFRQLTKIAPYFPQLKLIHVTCPGLTPADLEAFVEGLPNPKECQVVVFTSEQNRE